MCQNLELLRTSLSLTSRRQQLIPRKGQILSHTLRLMPLDWISHGDCCQRASVWQDFPALPHLLQAQPKGLSQGDTEPPVTATRTMVSSAPPTPTIPLSTWHASERKGSSAPARAALWLYSPAQPPGKRRTVGFLLDQPVCNLRQPAESVSPWCCVPSSRCTGSACRLS